MLKKVERLIHDFFVLLIVTLFDINIYDFIEKRRKRKAAKVIGTSNTNLQGIAKGGPAQVDFPCQYQLGDKEKEEHLYHAGDSRAG